VEIAVSDARASAGTAVVLTFDPHPSRVLSPDRAPSALMTVDQKAEVLESLGVDRLAVLPFTAELARETPEEFARLVLQQGLGARVVVVGAGFRFGRRRAGDVATLEGLGRGLGFRVHALPPLLQDGAPISSTRIREALARGDVEAAGVLLGRPFFIDGLVVAGHARGRSIGVPTANLQPVNETVPSRGVYACRCRRLGTSEPTWSAVANVGRRPTFGGGETTVEAHLLDFDGDLYGQSLRLSFIERLRDERRFPDVQALVAQIREDISLARRVLEKA
jgi:riboflavin kinase/FMN adenylyltransferase